MTETSSHNSVAVMRYFKQDICREIFQQVVGIDTTVSYLSAFHKDVFLEPLLYCKKSFITVAH